MKGEGEQVRSGQRSYTHLSKAPFAQNLDENEVVEVHLLGLWRAWTFNLPVLLASLSLHLNAVSLLSSVSSSLAVPCYRGDRQTEGLRFVLLSTVVERQSFPDALQLLRIWTETRSDEFRGLAAARPELMLNTPPTLVTGGSGGRL